MSSKPIKRPDSSEMSHISSEKSPWRPKKMVDVANNAAGSDNDLLYEPKKLDKVAKAYVDSSQDPTSKPGQKDPKSRRKPNLTIDPPSDLRNMDQPVGKFVSNSNITYNGIPSPSYNGIPSPSSNGIPSPSYIGIPSPRTPRKSEFPITSTAGIAGVTPASTRTNGGKSTSSFTNPSQGNVNGSRSNSLEGSNTPLRPHTGGDVRWDAINIVSKGSPLNLSNFRLLKRIGYGDIGSVYLVELRGTKTYFAMKVMDKGSLASRNKLLRSQTEREILGLLDHPFLPTLYSYLETDKFYCLVMEFCSGGNLHSLRQKQPNKHFTEEAARFYASEVLLALEYLHMLGIVYRDLKPENVLVREEGHIMLSDFDLSLRCSVSPTLVKSSATNVNNIGVAGAILDNELVIHGCMQPSNFLPRILPSKKNRKSKSDFGLCAGGSLPELMAEPTNVRSMSFVGTHEYLAPEIIRGEGHGSAVDWWTFGIFLYELLHGTTPFKGSGNRATLFNVVGQPLRFPETPQVSTVARDLIRGLLVKEPHKRIAYKRGATEIKQHPFFEGVNWALVRCATPPHIPDPVDFSQYASKEAIPAEKKIAEIGGGDKNSNSPKDPPYIDFEYF